MITLKLSTIVALLTVLMAGCMASQPRGTLVDNGVAYIPPMGDAICDLPGGYGEYNGSRIKERYDEMGGSIIVSYDWFYYRLDMQRMLVDPSLVAVVDSTTLSLYLQNEVVPYLLQSRRREGTLVEHGSVDRDGELAYFGIIHYPENARSPGLYEGVNVYWYKDIAYTYSDSWPDTFSGRDSQAVDRLESVKTEVAHRLLDNCEVGEDTKQYAVWGRTTPPPDDWPAIVTIRIVQRENFLGEPRNKIWNSADGSYATLGAFLATARARNAKVLRLDSTDDFDLECFAAVNNELDTIGEIEGLDWSSGNEKFKRAKINRSCDIPW